MAPDKYQAQLLASISGSQTDDEYADVTLTCKGAVFRAHKNIICPQSLFFKNACKKDAFKEGQSGSVDLPKDEPLAVKALLEYLYTAEYTSPGLYSPENLPLHAQTYVLADKYAIKPLKPLSLSKLSDDSGHIPEVAIPSFATTVSWIYENTERRNPIRDVVIISSIENLNRLVRDEAGEFSAMMATSGEFGLDLARALRNCTAFNTPYFRSSDITLDVPGSTHDEHSDSSSNSQLTPERSFRSLKLTRFRCDDCQRYWRLDVSEVPNDSENMLSCLACDAYLNNWDDRPSTLLYELKCVACKVRCLASDDLWSQEWCCCYCGSVVGGFVKPDQF